uniref:PHD-type domain-containing protein n=1 Tax=Ditylenchus dipsaci TaxID=166011 RepID=A0A915DPY1_9BILA
MSSLISAMPPTDLILKHENQSPHSLSNLSSPNTNAQQSSTIGASAGGNNTGFPYFGGVSPTEGSTASDSSQTGNTNPSNPTNNNQPTVPIGASGQPPHSLLEDDFGLNLHSQASTSGSSYPPSQQQPQQQQQHFNLPSPLKPMQLHNPNQQFCSPQLPPQFHPESQQQLHMQQQQPFFPQPTSQESTPPQFTMPHPMSHPGFFGSQPTPPAGGQTINIRNPFEEDENCRPVSHPGSTRQMPNSNFDYCHQSPPIPPNIHFEQYRQFMCQKMYPIGPGTCPQAIWEQEKAKLPYVWAHRQQFPRPYPVPIARSQMSPMMRMPSNFVMGPNGPVPIQAAMAAAAAAKCSPGQYPMGPGFVGYPPHLMPPGHPGQMMPQNQRPSSIGAVSNQAPTPAKQTANAKKKEKAASKRASKEAAAVAAQAQMAAAAQAQMHGPFGGNGMMIGGGPCSMMNGGGMMPQPDSSSSLSAQKMGGRMPLNGNTPSPQFKVPGSSPPLQRPNKLFNTKPEHRLPEAGDCFGCKNKVNPMNRGIRCTAIGQGCGMVFHFECAKMMNEAYTEFYKDTRLEWICEGCSRMKPHALSI